jgi:hypothetical protein
MAVRVTGASTDACPLVQAYLSDTNMLKTLKMEKEVQFDFRGFEQMVHGYIRSIGWRRGLSISFPKANYT